MIIVALFTILPLLFTLRLRHHALNQSPDVGAADYHRCVRAFHGCTLVFWFAWLGWYYTAEPLAPLAAAWPWIGASLRFAPSFPALMFGTVVSVAMRYLIYPVYEQRPDTTYPRTAFLLQGLWICCSFGVILMAGGALVQALANPVRAVVFLVLAPVCVFFFWRWLLSASGIEFVRLESGALRERVDALVRNAGMAPMAGLYLVRTRYQPLRNAFASIGGTLYLSEALLAQLTTREADAVIAHELTHLRHKHPRRFWGWLVVCGLIGAVALPAAYGALGYLPTAGWKAPLGEGVGGYVVCMVGALLGAAIALGRSRALEKEADLGAVEITGDPEAMISALVTLARKPVAPQRPRRKWRRPVTTHPSVQRRAEYIAEAGGVSPERVEALLAGETVGEAHYEVPPGAAPEDDSAVHDSEAE